MHQGVSTTPRFTIVSLVSTGMVTVCLTPVTGVRPLNPYRVFLGLPGPSWSGGTEV